jgi:hypothetical protein
MRSGALLRCVVFLTSVPGSRAGLVQSELAPRLPLGHMPRRAGEVAMSDWRPETVDPLGQAFGAPAKRERPYELWLDLRSAENTFAEMVVLKLFYSVRRVVDEAGLALPKGAAVQGLLFDAARYDRADTLGQNLPILLDTGAGLVNATAADAQDPVELELRAPASVEALEAARSELEAAGTPAAIALPADAMLWACSLTGLCPVDLEPKAGNEGA